jgi:hypothetical protein
MTTKDLRKTKNNPRIITDGALERLDETYQEYGSLSGVIYNEAIEQLVSGNQRITLANLKNGSDIEITERFKKPKQDGTTAFGYILIDGIREPYRAVSWEQDKHDKAVIIANKHAGEWDAEVLNTNWASTIDLWESEVKFEMPEDSEYQSEGDNTKGTLSNNEDQDNPYSTKIEAPIYEAKNEKPEIIDLYKNERFNQLIEEIENSTINKEEKEFLKLAAVRHIVFHYERIADFYAHSSKECQQLMENSALVIIDFNKAIELGYVKLSEQVANQYAQDYSNSEGIEDDE